MGALKAVTIEAAYSWQMENQIGSIEAGKLANFTILEENPLTVDARKIKEIKVWGTMLEGEIQAINKLPESDGEKQTVAVKRLPSVPQVEVDRSYEHAANHTGCVCSANRKFADVIMATTEKEIE